MCCLQDSSETAEELWRRNKQLLLRINEAKIDRSDPSWDLVSDGFKDFLDQVIELVVALLVAHGVPNGASMVGVM